MKKFVLRIMATMLAAIIVFSMGNVSMASAAAGSALDLSERVHVNGAAPADNADGSITFSGQASMKASFALPETLAAGESVKVSVKLKFDSDVDTGVRFYLIANGADSNTATEVITIANEGIDTEIEKTITLTAASDSTEVLLASSGYGVYIDNVTIYEIYVGDKPAETTDAASDLIALNLSERVHVNGAAPTDNADGSITFSGQASMKASFALPETLVAGESVTVNAKLKFDSDADTGVRFYLIANGADSNTATEVITIANEGTGTEIEKTITLTAASDSTEILLASSGYGVYIDNVTVYEVTLGDKPVVETPAEDTAIEIIGDEYVVQSGDTLGKIAAASGLTVKELADANNIENADVIATGAKLVIPTVDAAKRYIVVSGDTLSKIAASYNTTVADLVSANGIENADLIYVGQLIVLP